MLVLFFKTYVKTVLKQYILLVGYLNNSRNNAFENILTDRVGHDCFFFLCIFFIFYRRKQVFFTF